MFLLLDANQKTTESHLDVKFILSIITYELYRL